jgi:hypothetical protein
MFILGKRNKGNYGKTLFISGILWIIAFFGFIIELVVVSLGAWTLVLLGVSSYLYIPAVILTIIHGFKFKDNFFVLAGVLFTISWFVALILPWLSLG